MSDFRISDKSEDDLPRRKKHLDRKSPDIERKADEARDSVPRPSASDSVEKYSQYGKARAEAWMKALDEGYDKIPSTSTKNWSNPRSEAAKKLLEESDE